MKSRLIFVFLGLILLWGVLIFRGAYLQVLPNERLQSLKSKQFLTHLKIPGQRGAIYDREGRELAVSMAAYSLFADPKIIKNPRTVAKKLAKYLKISRKKLQKSLQKKKRRFVWVKRKLSSHDHKEIKSWGIRGLGFIEEPKRIYPNGSLLSQTLGLVGSEGQGLEGLERKYEKVLAGKEKKIPVRRDARGRPLIMDTQWVSENLDGKDLYLTIDRDLQYQLEKELQAAVKKHDADSAVGVILNVKNSEILGIGGYPTIDANKPVKRKDIQWRKNRAITDAFEPGSTLKTIAVAASLKNGKTSPNKKYYGENGRFKIGRRTINEADERHHFGWLTTTEILANSSNIGVTKVAFDLGAEKYREALLDFGFGVKTDVDFPGESKGILRKLPWHPHLLSNISFGHGVTVTPLQLATAYTAIANGGVWRKPRLVREIKNSLDESEDFFELVERRVLSEKDAAQMRLMLMTSGNARVPGFHVGGKTGTAQVVNKNGRGYVKGVYISSFAGFVPAHSPEFVIYVAVENPKKKAYYGSQVAAPVFSRVASYAVRKAGLSPVLISEKNLLPRVSKERTRAQKKKRVSSRLVPELRGLTLREVYQNAERNKIKIKVRGRGVVSSINPPPGFLLPENRQIDVELSE